MGQSTRDQEEAKKLPPLTDAMRAQAALDRITIPPHILEIAPRS